MKYVHILEVYVKMIEHHPLALSKIWKHCFKEIPNNPELRLALDKLDKESI